MQSNVRVACLLCATLLVVSLAGCAKPENYRVTGKNFDKIKKGMDIAQVEGILGKSDEQSTKVVDLGGATIIPGKGSVVHIWGTGKKKIVVLFGADNKVVEAYGKYLR